MPDGVTRWTLSEQLLAARLSRNLPSKGVVFSSTTADDEPCEFAGHCWEDAGGGMEICAECQAERWAEP
jgi:hypothetical protein